MTNSAPTADYKVRRPDDKTASEPVHAPYAAVAEFLQLLAKAAHQFHTYPATSPLCTEAIDTCHRAFIAMQLEQPLTLRVTAHEIIIDEETIGRGTVIEQELARPLHRARVASVEIERAVSSRDWSQFCIVLASGVRGLQSEPSLAELLVDAGVGAIVPRVTPRPEVFEVGAPAPAVQTLVDAERLRQASIVGKVAAQYLYPPDKGWVRVDPGVAYESISLLDLAVLVNDPGELAGMLAHLIDDDDSGDGPRASALEQRYGDVVMLIGALDPRLGRVLFSKLARAVLALDTERRRALLRRAILPGLLDGRADAPAVLAEFPDVDLADALCLLLDLEAAAPELLPVALDRLRLSDERRTAVVPLIAESLDRKAGSGEAVDRWAAAGLDRHASALTRVRADAAANFSEFAAFDLSMNEQTAATLEAAREAIARTDGIDAQLGAALGLVRIEPNPAIVEGMLARPILALQTLAREQRWNDLSRWASAFGEVASTLDESRADVSRTVRDALQRVSDRDLVRQIAELCSAESGRTHAAAIVAALGPALVPAWIEALASPADRPRVRPLGAVMSGCARQVAPAIAERIGTLSGDAACVALSVLGFAGAGYEPCIAEQVTADDERRSREALRALARIGSARAAALIVGQLENGPAPVRPAAEEALWRLPQALALGKTRELLGRRDFVTHHPQTATRLLERAAQSPDGGFGPLLESLTPLRFHFWSPAVARVGAKARELLQ